MHFYAWKSGLKTGMYYLRTQAAASAIQFTVSKETKAQPTAETATATPSLAPQAETNGEVAPTATAAPSQLATPVMVSSQAAGGVQPVNLADAQAQITCSLDNPEGCEMCGS